MSQRLNITIVCDDKIIANAHYRWYGYTGPSLELLDKVCTKILSECDILGLDLDESNSWSDNDRVSIAVEALQATGAVISKSEMDRINKNYDHELYDGIDFNVSATADIGTIYITDEGIKSIDLGHDTQIIIGLHGRFIWFNIYDEIETTSSDIPKGFYDRIDSKDAIDFSTIDIGDSTKLLNIYKDHPNGYEYMEDDKQYTVTWY